MMSIRLKSSEPADANAACQPLPLRSGRAAEPAGLEAERCFSAASLVVGLAISVAILWAAGISPLELAGSWPAFSTATACARVLVQAAPLMLVGLGASLAFRIGFWNLGLEGQMVFGGIFAAASFDLRNRAAGHPAPAHGRSLRRSAADCGACSPDC